MLFKKGGAVEKAGLGGEGCGYQEFDMGKLRLRCLLDAQMDMAKRQLGI